MTKPTPFKEPHKVCVCVCVCVYCHTYLWKAFTPRHTNRYIQIWMSDDKYGGKVHQKQRQGGGGNNTPPSVKCYSKAITHLS